MDCQYYLTRIGDQLHIGKKVYQNGYYYILYYPLLDCIDHNQSVECVFM